MVNSLSHEELSILLKKSRLPFLIDVRDADFAEGGIIKGAVNIPLFDLNAEKIKYILEDVNKQRTDKIVCYCKFGKARSVQSAGFIHDYLLKNENPHQIEVSYLKGGFQMFRAWYHDTDLITYIK